jgi:hypothetical protein
MDRARWREEPIRRHALTVDASRDRAHLAEPEIVAGTTEGLEDGVLQPQLELVPANLLEPPLDIPDP